MNSKIHQIFFAVGANLLMSAMGLTFGTSGFLIPKLENPLTGFGISLEQGSWLASIMVLGNISGSFGGALQSGKLGRRCSIMIDSIIHLLAIFMLAFAPNFVMVLVARFLQGHSVGSGRVAITIYTSEICQPEIRKYTGSFAMIFILSGFLFAAILGASLEWRMAVGIPSFIPICCFIIVFVSPESPRWLMIKSRYKEALQSLITLRGKSNMDMINAEIESIEKSISEGKIKETNQSSKKNLFMKYWKIVTDRTFLEPFCLVLLIFAIGLEWGGFPAITMYMVPFLRSANVSMDPFWASVLLQAIRFVLVFMGLPITGKFKKKVVYLTCCGISCLGTLTLATYSYLNMDKQLTSSYPWTGYIPLFAIVLMYIAFAFGLGTIPFMLQGELFPSHARSFGSGLIGFIQMISLFISTKMVPTFTNLMGTHGLFYLYSSLNIFVALICYFAMPDTSGLSLEEIENIYKEKSKLSIRQ